MGERAYWVYILASGRNGTLYVGVTSDLIRRVWQHKEGFVEGFTNNYRVHDLVWYEYHSTAECAIAREKQIKKWHRSWKVRIIETTNPYWNDLYFAIVDRVNNDTGSPPSRGRRVRESPKSGRGEGME